ncbi:protein yellow-like [Trichogramma pretiosum]|uniref:protein yellow-like n=1 Tax=Trichogramma pretiosum TaxID=7493 RepID=UPI0006C9CCBE|nr:protein yellow-like [Trichogramma pretiosum]XP_023315818.1 protein yellow-like [Trichogramma pretiosum]
MRPAALIIPLLLLLAIGASVQGIDRLRVAYQWKQLDFDWPDSKDDDVRRAFPSYDAADNLPLGLEVGGDRLFVTVPRWRRGVAASLNYIRLNDTRESPPLIPYPSWEAHEYRDDGRSPPEIVSPFRIRADRCDRLWVLDTGLSDILGSPEQQSPPSLLVYDLRQDKLLRRYAIPEDQRTPDSLFANLVVEDHQEDCADAHAYLADLGGPGLVVYSWRQDSSWLIKHHYFHPDPMAGEFNVGGVVFHWSDGVLGMALQPHEDGYSTLYFHPLTSTAEFSVGTRLLRDPKRADTSEGFHEFRLLGSRGPNGQSSVSFLDPASGVLVYALTNLNAIACWRAGSRYTLQRQGRVYMDNVTMVFPNDIKIDRRGTIYVLSDRLPAFMYNRLDPEDYNYRILTGNLAEAVNGTVCEPPRTSSKDSNGALDTRINRLPSSRRNSATAAITSCGRSTTILLMTAALALAALTQFDW